MKAEDAEDELDSEDRLGVSSNTKQRRCDDIHIDLHVLVDSEMNVHESHHHSYAIENKIKRDFREVTDVVVNMEPMEKEQFKNGRRS